jgi:hypothetical protein
MVTTRTQTVRPSLQVGGGGGETVASESARPGGDEPNTVRIQQIALHPLRG